MTPRSIALLAASVAIVGCDPTATGTNEDAKVEAKSAAQAEDADAKADAKAEADADEPADDPGRDFAVCMAACAGGKRLSPTDQATCRLNCDPPGADAETAELEGTKAVMVAFEQCDAGCDDDKPTNRMTCRLTCAQKAPEKKTELTDVRRGCSTACLDQLISCETKCSGDKDAIATCRVQCEAAASHCIDKCQEDQ